MALDTNKIEENEIEITTDAEDLPEVEIEVEDDTPPQDRNKAPLPKEIVDELEKDDLSDYSERVKTRMAQLRKVYHDERRAKEAADREREEALRFARAAAEENKRLKSTLGSGEKVYVDTLRGATEQELKIAKSEYKEAYDSGDTDKIIAAQEKMNAAQFKLAQLQNYKPQYEETLQKENNSVEIQPTQQPKVVVDKKAQDWQAKNPWFGSNRVMSSLAYGLHEDLIASGVSPSSDEYYRRIDTTMRQKFPEYDWGEPLDEVDEPAQRNTKKTTVVASATRSTAPKKVHLTKSQLAFAAKLGITPAQYAVEMLKLEKQ